MPTSELPQARTHLSADASAPSNAAKARAAYGRSFWLAYASNVLTITATTVLFRYSDFVMLLGGSELHLGWIVGIGMIGSLGMRLWMGSCIDCYGSRVVWLGSIALMVASSLGHLAVTDCVGVAIYGLRIALTCSFAGAFGAGMAFVSHETTPKRLAESFAMFGTSSFVGSLLGAPLSDFLFGSGPVDRAGVDRMFLAVVALAVLAFPLAWAATRNETRLQRVSGPSTWQLLWRYCPRTVFVIGVAVGIVLQLPYAFLRPYAAGLDIPRVGLFFVVYAVAAILARILTRRWNERLGTRSVILLGIAVLVAGQLSFLWMHSQWQLALPATILGFSQAVLFPTITAAGNVAFPAGNRGLATTLVLAAFDVGLLIGSPTAGVVLNSSSSLGLPPYPTMFVTTAAIVAAVGLWYAVVAPSRPPADLRGS